MSTVRVVRPVRTAELGRVADLYLIARRAAGPAMPLGVHSDAEVRAWVRAWDLSQDDVLGLFDGDHGLRGFARLAGAHLEALYVDPAAQGNGVGGTLLDEVKRLRPDGFDLWVFVANSPAQDFYRRRGLVEVERTDGAGNEERAPDIRMAWIPRQPSR
ncbi:GNAT family N-acetyltransferase [Occultella gossypii]|uniref:GNAT family N-acetyltransferase n=1 Tax=Occultella gossypii TaxID=2800820 RepID=A0ABS7SEP5_9MICO|nr:GNAT family N-acetyltransferase [Occultella gossypii]MBZ2197771.1 GNAT family N-acetyltransferase [Occultella gossypii]